MSKTTIVKTVTVKWTHEPDISAGCSALIKMMKEDLNCCAANSTPFIHVCDVMIHI